MKKTNKGQVALIVLIISAVVLTLGLSLSKRSVVDTKITTDEELLKQAFNAAESGIDNYLGTGKTGVASYQSPDQRSQADVSVSNIGGGSGIVSPTKLILRNNSNYTWMIGRKSDGSPDVLGPKMNGVNSLTICVNDAFSGSLKMDYFYRDAGGNYSVYRAGANVNTGVGVSNYSSVNPGTGTCPFNNSGMKPVSVSGGTPFPSGAGLTPLLLVVTPIGGDTRIAVSSNSGNFPDQAIVISSTGKAGDVTNGSGVQVNREVNEVYEYQIPAFMLEAITAVGQVSSE